MLRNFLAGTIGDQVNCILAGCAFNLKKRLNALREVIFALVQMKLLAAAVPIEPKHLCVEFKNSLAQLLFRNSPQHHISVYA